MADYRDYHAEAAADRARVDEEQKTGFRGGFGETATCLTCGCKIGDRVIHREKCTWTPKVPVIVYREV